jgi:choline dehydrogenase-like flavoprotein
MVSSRLTIIDQDRGASTREHSAIAAPVLQSARQIAQSLAHAIIPDGRVFPGGNARTIERVEATLDGASPGAVRSLIALFHVLDKAAIASTGRRFVSLDADAQERMILKWEQTPAVRLALFAVASLFKSVHFDDPEVYRAMGCVFEKGGPAEPARWLSQVVRPDDVEDKSTIECDVVVVGTGAGGAVVGKELTERGLAVVFLEEGELHRRDSFRGHVREARKKMYRGRAMVASIGNTVMPIFMGRMVGGSTAINTATCFRTPSWILSQWCDDLATDELSEEALRPHFDRVEATLQVETAKAKYLGGVARVIGRGCDKLGWHHFPVRRNAPDCDGQGVCDYGCPTDAKRSTNISYIPHALSRGALLYTSMRADRVLIEGDRAVGILARGADSDKELTVRARAVVLAGGAIPTPMLLLAQGIANRSGEIGKNLSTHPATAVSAVFDERIEAYNAIPQGYGVDHFHRQGILLLGASAPLDVGALMFPFSGRRLMDTMEAYDRVAMFGAMIEDESRGRVRVGPGGKPLITYWLGKHDVEKLHRGMIAISQIFRAAGASRIFPFMARMPILEGDKGIDQLRSLDLKSRDLLMTCFHPLGTCRMGHDPKTSVIGLDHETHDIKRLFVVDGSAVPGPPAVNPQLTIMALADRAAKKIAERLDG